MKKLYNLIQIYLNIEDARISDIPQLRPEYGLH